MGKCQNFSIPIRKLAHASEAKGKPQLKHLSAGMKTFLMQFSAEHDMSCGSGLKGKLGRLLFK